MRRAAAVCITLVLVLGLWELGQGAWVYAKAHLAQYLLQRAWQHAVQGEIRPRPWPWADTWPVARLRVPKHGIDLIVLAGASGRTLAFGPAQVQQAGDEGQSLMTIMTAHRDTHFRFLEHLGTGDEIFVQERLHGWFRYRVKAKDIVDARHARIMHDAVPHLALVTCYPFDTMLPGGLLRYVVTAEQVSFDPPSALR